MDRGSPENPGRGDTRVRALLGARQKMELSHMQLVHYPPVEFLPPAN
jgi:hypothetical protein